MAQSDEPPPRLDTLPHEILLAIFVALKHTDRFFESISSVRLTSKTLCLPATDFLLGEQDLNLGIEPLEKQTRMLNHCHTLCVWLHSVQHPPRDPINAQYMREYDFIWAPELESIWKHHYSSSLAKDVERQASDPDNSSGGSSDSEDRFTAAEMESSSPFKLQLGDKQLQHQWPGAFDGTLEQTIRELLPRLKPDTRIIFVNSLIGKGSYVPRNEHQEERKLEADPPGDGW